MLQVLWGTTTPQGHHDVGRHQEMTGHSRYLSVRFPILKESLYYEKKRLEKQEAEILARRLVQSCSDER